MDKTFNKGFKDVEMARAEQSEASGNTGGQIENRLGTTEFIIIQNLFTSPGLTKPTCMTKEEFVEKAFVAVGRGLKREYGELFDKIDVTRDGSINWDKLTSFMLLELYEKDERSKLLVVPQWKNIRFLPLLHKDVIQKIVYLKASKRYLTLSKDGLLGVWGESLKLPRSLRIATDTVKLKDLWATSLVSLANVNKIAVAFTSKEICFYDLNSKQEFSCQYKLQGFKGTPICMDYWYNPDDGNEAVLTFGNVCGQVQVLGFTTALISLFERPDNSMGEQDTVVTIGWQELVSGYHKCCYTLQHKRHAPDWVRQVSYSSHLEAFISCTNCSRNTVVLAWRERGKPQLRTSSINISQGVNAFDYNTGLNLIATAGIDHKVCLWNPYVVSKPTGLLQGNVASVIAVQFMVGRKLLFSFSKDKVLRIWDIHHQLCIQRIAGIFPKMLDFYSFLSFHEAQGCLFLSFNNQLTLLEMKQETGTRVTSHEKPVTYVLYNSSFKQVISSDTGSTVTFWMIDTGQKLKQFTGCHGDAEISAMALDATETRLLTGGTDGTVKIWDFNGHCHHKLNAGRNQSAEISQILVLKRTILVMGWERITTVFRLNTLTRYLVQPAEWKGGVQHQDDILCAAFLPPQSLATDSHVQSQHSSRSLSSAFSGRCTVSADGSYDSETEINNSITRLFFLEARKNISVTGGANLVSSGGSGQVRFWNIFRSQLMAEFPAHDRSIVMTVDKSNHYLITGDLDGWMKVWDIQDYCLDFSNGKIAHPPPLVKCFQPHQDCVTHVETCGFGKRLLVISASADCSISLSDIYGRPIGIFGQEEHWQIEDSDPLPQLDFSLEETMDNNKANEDDMKKVPITSKQPSFSVLQDTAYLMDVRTDSPYVISPWENTILGKKFKESKTHKEKSYMLLKNETTQNSIGTFSSLNIGALQDVTEVRKPDFILNPERYFGEKTETRHPENMELPTLAETLKAAFDEKSLFPREILEREQKSRQSHKKNPHQDKMKGNKKPTRLHET
uniref:WD repeat-containing protein 49 isoform X2 n=1 Tax=Geotrypetes seraphini TaxID=260995 RepID=A0A6P8S8Q3_GEOSA|nr:WD repeat-containing protein 49 isoform X2 [Geotrypetes seraphini]